MDYFSENARHYASKHILRRAKLCFEAQHWFLTRTFVLSIATKWLVTKTTTMKKILFLLLFSPSLFAQTILKAKDLLADFEIVRKSYEQMHPGLYKYQTKATIDSAFEDFKAAWSKDQTLAEAYLNLHKLTAQFKCGHGYPNSSWL